MRKMRALRLVAALTVLLCVSFLPAATSRAALLANHGVYIDSSGAKQSWHVNTAHTLVWNDKAFVPVGGLFQARSWTATGTDADWDSDKQALDLLKSRNITDIYVQPARGGLTVVPPANLQRLIDYLDAQGFTYGISINDGPREALTGYVVRPGAYRQEVPEAGGQMKFAMDNLASALYFIVTPSGSDVQESGEAKMTADGATINARNLPGSFVAFLIPKKVYYFTGRGNAAGVPNLWDGFDGYRDSLISLFRRVHTGKGFRFFVDALPKTLSLESAEAERLIPTGPGFATEWSAYLGRRYKSLEALDQAWGVLDHESRDIDQAAQLIPLWSGGKGIGSLYDPTTSHTIKVDTQRSSFWNDMTTFKARSVRRYMNDLALTLKRAVADVPIVYRSSGYSAFFSDLPADDGFDGIGIDAYGRGSDLVTGSAGYVYAQASESPRTMWLPVTGTADAPPTKKTAPGYASRLAFQSDLDYLRDIGARGFYVTGVRIVDPAEKMCDLSQVPDQLGYLADYQRMLVATGVRAADSVPNAVFYPRGLRSASVRPIANHAWWLPTDRPGVFYDFGPVGHAYALSENGAAVYYLFNPDGIRRIHLRLPKANRLPGATPVAWSTAANGEIHKDILALTIGPDPIRVMNLSSLPVPTETFEALNSQATALTKVLRARNILDTGRFEAELSNAKIRFNVDQPYTGVLDVERIIAEMREVLRPYAWIEAESSLRQTFDEISDRAGASGGRVLLVDPRAAGAPAAIATYTVTVRANATYELWVAASPDAPLSFRLDDQPVLDSAVLPTRVGAPYANGSLVWMKYGLATLPKGQHRLEVRANGPAAVDVILLINPGQFVPDGPNPPALAGL